MSFGSSLRCALQSPMPISCSTFLMLRFPDFRSLSLSFSKICRNLGCGYVGVFDPTGHGSLVFTHISAQITVKHFNGRTAFVPKGQPDRGLARSAWPGVWAFPKTFDVAG